MPDQNELGPQASAPKALDPYQPTVHPVRETAGRSGSILFFLVGNDFPPLITATIRADHMGQDRFTALGAVLQLLRLQGIVGPPAARFGIRLTAFGYGHPRGL